MMSEQQQVKRWFDSNYKKRGFQYLRPLEAYGIYAKLLDLAPGQTLLDVACGPGLMLRQGLDHGARALGVDISEAAIDMARAFVPEAQTQVGNAEALPFTDHTADAVTCLGSLERMLDLDAVLKEIHRVGKPEAKFCFLVRNSETVWWKLVAEKLGFLNKEGHQGANTLQAWQARFEANDFKVQAVYPDQWPFVRGGQMASLGLYKPNPLKLRRGLRPLRRAYEFVFVLRKV
jgi:SAM-dependent methyltransferase